MYIAPDLNNVLLMHPFKALGVHDDLVKGIERLGFDTPTPVQQQVIPELLQAEGDYIALAQTGTGKTAAFGLPLLQRIDPNNPLPQALVLCPTRELCLQVSNDLRNFSVDYGKVRITAIYGGADISRQIRELRSGTQIIVATPGRLLDVLEREVTSTEHLNRVVLDEADEMLNMGFKDDLEAILAAIGTSRTVWLFSATMSDEVRRIASRYMKNPGEWQAGPRNQAAANIEHRYFVCAHQDAYAVLRRTLDFYPGIFGLIFCRTRNETRDLAEQLGRDGYRSDALHGDLSQKDRDRVMDSFRRRELQLLIATDVAARGIDVSDISHVIHFGLPDDMEVYTHRSGRTGRAGKSGMSISIISPRDTGRMQQLGRMIRAEMIRTQIPNGKEICTQQINNWVEELKGTEPAEAQLDALLPTLYEELADLSKEDIIRRLAGRDLSRFLTAYAQAPDLNIPEHRSARNTSFREREGNVRDRGSRDRVERGDRSDGLMKRLFISVGEMDGMGKGDILGLITRTAGIPGAAIGKIELGHSFSFVGISEDAVPVVKSAFLDTRHNGRSIRIDDASPSQRIRTAPVAEYAGGDSRRPRKKY
jgi:ATP-dependent RNA helicase DeaD